jgi:hypothetical protein
MNSNKTPSLVLRIAIAFAFLFVAQAALRDPISWIGYAPSFVQNLFPENILAILLALAHIVIGVWILSGWKVFIPSILAAVFLLSIVLFNFSQIDILFRDISLALASVALAIMHRPEKQTLE